MPRLLVGGALLVLLIAGPSTGENAPEATRRRPRLVLASLDGAGAKVVADAVARGLMPALAALRAEGAAARGSITSLPAKTASGHATLFTGAWPDVSGVTGNAVVLPGASLLEPVSGYTSEALRGEPLWVTAARQGLRATMLSATQDYPYEPYEAGGRFGGPHGDRLVFLTGYKGAWVQDVVYRAKDLVRRPAAGWRGAPTAKADEIELSAGETTVHGLLLDDPADPARGFDTLLLALDKDAAKAARLKPAPLGTTDAWSAVPVRLRGYDFPVFFRLFALSGDGSDLVLYRARSGAFLSNRPPLASAVTEATGGFVGNGAGHAYETGGLGRTLADGGDGTAESRYLETARLVERQFERLLDFGATRTEWDLLVGYLPFPDELLHRWWGYLDPSLPGHDPVLASGLRPFLDEGLRIADAYVAALRRHAGPDAVLAVGADHGMTSVRTRVRLNAALRDAGLLALDASGRIDLARTKAYYLEPGGYFLFNGTERPAGSVPEEETSALRARIESVLRGLRDPRSGRSLVEDVFLPGAREGTGGTHGGDLYLRLVPHALPTGEASGDVVYEGAPRGEHILAPDRDDMHASFAVAGPGVAVGADLGIVRQVDLAPTLAALLGLAPPAQSRGVVLERALDRRSPASRGALPAIMK
jgi:predicted AlkP superfamily phosphohydrolase/phosphomutase